MLAGILPGNRPGHSARMARTLYQVAFAIMSLFATDIPLDDLRDIIDRSYNAQVFGSDLITPCVPCKTVSTFKLCPTARRWRLLSPCSFSAARWICVGKEGKSLNILGATSGGTWDWQKQIPAAARFEAGV